MAREVKAFLNPSGEVNRVETPEIKRLEAKLETQARTLTQLRGRIRRSRQQLARKNEEIGRLRARLTEVGGGRGSRNFLDRHPQVFFLVGRGRSGTTWLQSLLNFHPEILCKGEGYLFDRNFRREEFRDERLKVQASSLYNAISNSEYLRLWVERSVWTGRKDVEDHLDNLTRLAIEYLLTGQLSKTGKRIVGDKTPFISAKVSYEMHAHEIEDIEQDTTIPYNGAEVLEEISRIFPEARVIHVIRDGRDVAVSLMHFIWNYAKNEGKIYHLEPEELARRDAYRKDPSLPVKESLFTEKRLTAIARGWKAEVDKAVKDCPVLLKDRYAEVRYEDLVREPETEIQRLLEFLGADASEEMVRECIDATSFERLSRRERGQEESTSTRYRKGITGDWKNVFTERDKRIFKREAGDLLVKLGYEKNHNW